jgi:voltage-gated sodium channel
MYTTLVAALSALRHNRIFEMVVITVIIISALEIGAKTFPLSDTALLITMIMDRAITIFFLCEIIIRFIAEPRKKDFLKSGWNIFDTLVVVISLVPVNESEMALLARLIRVFRVLRMISIIPELRLLINSLLKAMPKMGYVVLLMFIIFYIYAAMGSYLFAPINEVLWGNIAIAMLTLFRVMTFEDWTDIMYETQEVYGFSWIYYMTFIFLTAFAFLNMVIGIVINVMEQEQREIREEEAAAHPEMQDISNKEVNAELHAQISELQDEIGEIKALLLAQQAQPR